MYGYVVRLILELRASLSARIMFPSQPTNNVYHQLIYF